MELHPEKTRLIEFGRYAEERRAKRGDGPPETFDFLGFTHISGKTRRGDFTIHRKTSRKKFHAKLLAIPYRDRPATTRSFRVRANAATKADPHPNPLPNGEGR